MMVVIGIIAILGAVAIPGFKKIYSDFKIRETYALIDDALSEEISFYLIRNEWSQTVSWNGFEERTFPFLSQRLRKFINGTLVYLKRKGYKLPELYKGLYLFPKVDISLRSGCFSISKENYEGSEIVERVWYLENLLERYRKKGCSAWHDSRVWIVLPGGLGSSGNMPEWFR